VLERKLDKNKLTKILTSESELSWDEFLIVCEGAKINARTIERNLSGVTKSLHAATMREILAVLSKIAERKVRPAEILKTNEQESQPIDGRRVREWTIQDYGQVITCPNGLQFQTHKLWHEIAEQFDCGKLYDLHGIHASDRRLAQECLRRHHRVLKTVEPHSVFPIYRQLFQDKQQDRWWLIESWVDGNTLEHKLQHGPLSPPLLSQVMYQLAEGLFRLHQADIIRRELSPRFVLLTHEDESVLLTHCELAKLLDGSPTASAEARWPKNPYRAPEAMATDSRTLKKNADLYSWARILVHAYTGQPPPKPGDEQPLLTQPEMERLIPKPIRTFTTKSLSPSCEKRPDGFDKVMPHLRKWHQSLRTK